MLKYLTFIELLIRKEASLSEDGYRFYFDNFNVLGIFQKMKREVEKKKEIFNKIDCFVDVGAHYGAMSFLINNTNPSVFTIAFEPNPHTFSFLERNLKHIKNKTLFNKGLSSAVGKSEMYFDSDHYDTASLNRESFFLNKNARSSVKSEKVEIGRLDSLLADVEPYRSIYLKIDVETLENEVLKGGEEILKKVKYLEIEVTQDGESTLSKTLNLLPNRKYNTLGFDFVAGDSFHYPIVVNLLLEFLD